MTVRVFPRRTKATPTDSLAFVGGPPLWVPEAERVLVSCTFTRDIAEAERLQRAWQAALPRAEVSLGGPAFGDPGGDFTPGMFLREGYVVTSRGCPNHCGFCLVPTREGAIRELPVTPGYNILDNNLLACSDGHLADVFAMLRTQRERVQFTGGLEAARVTPEVVEQLRTLRIDQLFLAYDSPGAWLVTERAIRLLRKAGLGRDTIRCYVLMGREGDTPDAAAERGEQVLRAGGIPFAMLYQPDTHEVSYSREWEAVRRKYILPAAMLPRGRRAELNALLAT